jgi:competence protein ComEC
MLLSFTGGILVSYKALHSYPDLSIPIFLSVVFSLLAYLFLPSRLRLYCLFLAFFLTGIMLEQGKHSPSRLMPFATQRTKATIEGTVLEPIRIINNMARLKVKADLLFVEDKTVPVNDNVSVSIYNHIPSVRPGERIRFPARLRPFKNFNNPGRYDYESAMRLKGFTCAASASDGRRIVPMGPGHLSFPRGLIEKIQRPVRDFLSKRLNDQDYALFRALILGERQGINQELRELFNQTGLGHVLAVSGLHIGLVAWMTFFLFKWTLSRSYNLPLKTDLLRITALLTCLPVIGYTFLAGYQISGQRAMTMALIFLWSLIFRREKDVWSTLAFAALVILTIDPHAIFSISFQLSFSAVIGILWLAPPLLNKILSPLETTQSKNTIFKRLYIYFIGLFVVSLSATIFLLPLTIFYFHRVSLVTIPANLTVVPILGLWVLPFGLLCVAALPFSFEIAGLFLQLGTWGLHTMIEIIRFWAGFPWSNLWMITPSFSEFFMFYSLMLLLFFIKRWSWAKKGILALVLLILLDIGYWTYSVGFNKQLKVTFLDVGQANSALVEFPMGKKMLIDGGGFSRGHFDVGRMVVAPYLWHSKIRRIDYLVLSHPQADHMNGLRFIASNFHPKEFWYNGDEVEKASFKELMAIIESKKIKKFLPADLAGGREINGVKVEIIHPFPHTHSTELFDRGTRLNNNSLVLKISYGGQSFLFPGDLERQGEEVLVSNAGQVLKSDILLSPHHGSKSSSSKEFLRMVRPRICVISSGDGNFFGFPHQQTLESLRAIGCRVIRIDQAGAVQCRVGGNKFEISTFVKK